MLRVAILIVIALGLAGVSGWATLVAQERAVQTVLNEYEQQLVWVVVEPIEEGEILTEAIREGRIERQLFPVGFLPDEAVLEFSDWPGDSFSTRRIDAGSLLLERDFEPQEQSTATDFLTGNEVAVALDLPEAQRGGGLVLAGSSVGVVVAEEDPETGIVVNRVLFGSVRVLSSEGEIVQGSNLPANQQPGETTVVLAIAENDVSRLLDAYANGEITLVVLRDDQSLPIVQRG